MTRSTELIKAVLDKIIKTSNFGQCLKKVNSSYIQLSYQSLHYIRDYRHIIHIQLQCDYLSRNLMKL